MLLNLYCILMVFTHVKPVERRIPARMVETVDLSDVMFSRRDRLERRERDPNPPASELVRAKLDKQIQESHKELLASGRTSDCKVICGDVEWATHKKVLCSRNQWFRAALEGHFQESSTGVVTIQDTHPDVVQTVLHAIYTGEAEFHYHTPARIVEIWKAGDFFDIPGLVREAENAMSRRLKNSDSFLSELVDPSVWPKDGRGCDTIRAFYTGCGHEGTERRECPVRSLRPGTALHLREPNAFNSRHGWCYACHIINREPGSWPPEGFLFRGQFWQFNPTFIRPHEKAVSVPRSEARERVQNEIQALCDALILATNETPLGSTIQKALADHICGTRVQDWGDFTACTFLDS